MGHHPGFPHLEQPPALPGAPFLSSTVLLYCQPTLLHSLAQCMDWPVSSEPLAPAAIHFSGCSAGSYIALETEYRLLCRRLRQPMLRGGATVGGLGCPVHYLVALLLPHYCAGNSPTSVTSASSMSGRMSSGPAIPPLAAYTPAAYP